MILVTLLAYTIVNYNKSVVPICSTILHTFLQENENKILTIIIFTNLNIIIE